MPRQKRTLEASADTNTTVSAPKRSKRIAAGKENTKQPTASSVVASTSKAPKAPNATARKAKEVVTEPSTTTTVPTTKRGRKAVASKEKASEQNVNTKANANANTNTNTQPTPSLLPNDASTDPTDTVDPSPLKWITLTRLAADRTREAAARDDNDNNNEGEDEEAAFAKFDAELEKYHKKPLFENPDWPWRVSEEAYLSAVQHARGIELRLPDNFDMYVYNDFWGYGTVQVLENMLQEWAKAYRAKDVSVWTLWVHVETLAHFFNLTPDLHGFANLDDYERVEDILELVGLVLLTTLNNLAIDGLLRSDGPVKDLELVISLFLHWIASYIEDKDISWPHQVIVYANLAHLKLDKLHNMQAILDQFPEDEIPKRLIKNVNAPPKLDKFGFKRKWGLYVGQYGLFRRVGGQGFDITKMPVKERKKYHFDGKDPLEGMDLEELGERLVPGY